MPTTVRVIGVSGPTGANLRARLYAGTATTSAVDVPLTESPAGSGQYGGAVSATLADGGYEVETREVATPDAAGFDGSATVRATRGLYGYLLAGVWSDARADLRQINGGPVEAEEVTGLGNRTTEFTDQEVIFEDDHG